MIEKGVMTVTGCHDTPESVMTGFGVSQIQQMIEKGVITVTGCHDTPESVMTGFGVSQIHNK